MVKNVVEDGSADEAGCTGEDQVHDFRFSLLSLFFVHVGERGMSFSIGRTLLIQDRIKTGV